MHVPLLKGKRLPACKAYERLSKRQWYTVPQVSAVNMHCTALAHKLRCKGAHLQSSSTCPAQGLPAGTAHSCAEGPGRH